MEYTLGGLTLVLLYIFRSFSEGIITNTCPWQNQTGLITVQLPAKEVPYTYGSGRGRHTLTYNISRANTTIQLSFKYWFDELENITIGTELEKFELENTVPKTWIPYAELFYNLSSNSQIEIVVSLKENGVIAISELSVAEVTEENETEFTCTNETKCNKWTLQGFLWNSFHPYFVLGNTTKTEVVINRPGKYKLFCINVSNNTDEELNITYYINGPVDKTAKLLLYIEKDNNYIKIWEDEKFEAVWKTLNMETEYYIRPNTDYKVILQAETDGAIIALSSIEDKQTHYIPSVKYASKATSRTDFVNSGWRILGSPPAWHHRETEDWYLFLNNEAMTGFIISSWLYTKNENDIHLKYRKIGSGEVYFTIDTRNENGEIVNLHEISAYDESLEWTSLSLKFSEIGTDFMVIIKGVVKENETELHVTQLSVNDPCDPTPCVEGTCNIISNATFICNCNFGFMGELCDQIDWCVRDHNNITGNEFCGQRNASCRTSRDANTFICECDVNTKYFEADRGCVDLDLCYLKNCGIHEECENNLCRCKKHYEKQNVNNKTVCQPINYCERGNCGKAKCRPGPENHPEDYVCFCDKGYIYKNQMCENIQCKFPSLNRCSQHCAVEGTHYKCSCNVGFVLENNTTCSVADAWKLCDTQCENGVCIIDIATNRSSCICNKGYTYKKGKCINICTASNGTIDKSICLSRKCTTDPDHVYRCDCDSNYVMSEDGVTCKVRDWCTKHEEGFLKCEIANAICEQAGDSYICTCPPGTENDGSGICKEFSEIERYQSVCIPQNSIADVDVRNNPTCFCLPAMRYKEEKCSLAPYSFIGSFYIPKKSILQDGVTSPDFSFLRNLINESMAYVFHKSGLAMDFRSISLLNCQLQEADYACKIQLLFEEDVDVHINVVKNSAHCLDENAKYCIIPPRLVVNHQKLKIASFNHTDFCKDVSDQYCLDSTICESKLAPIPQYTCKCRPGYERYNTLYPDNSAAIAVELCKDINECNHNRPCPRNSRCVNMIGSYRCECSIGFKPKHPNLEVLILTNECIPVCDPNPCVYGECIEDDIEGFTCECNVGFSGVLCDEEDDDYKRLTTNLIIVGSVLGGALLITFIITYVFFNRQKKKQSHQHNLVIQLRGRDNGGFPE